jgi:hypothetical protein
MIANKIQILINYTFLRWKCFLEFESNIRRNKVELNLSSKINKKFHLKISLKICHSIFH